LVTLLHNTVAHYAVKVPRPKIHDDALRGRLIDTAARLLADEGPAALSTRRIARDAGTSTTAIYTLLGSKEQIVRAMYLEGFRRLADRQNAVERTSDPVADLCALGRAYFENGIENPHLYDVMFHRALREFTPEPDDVMFALSTLGDVVEIAQRCIDAGEFVGPPDDIAREAWALVHGVTSLVIAEMLDPDDGRERLDHLYRLSIAGYRREAEAARPAR
jgi:AcrR family transcriptional regulator